MVIKSRGIGALGVHLMGIFMGKIPIIFQIVALFELVIMAQSHCTLSLLFVGHTK
jgi:hypothetical protein